MRRREFTTLLGGALVWSFDARAQVSKRPYRIAYLALAPSEDVTQMIAFTERLKELGYVDGRDITIDYRSAEGRSEQLTALAAEIVKGKPDVIVAGYGTQAAQAAKAATKDIPIVFISVGDPLGAQLVTNLARPDGNITGLASQATETVTKRLEILEKLLPSQSIVAVLLNSNSIGPVQALKEIRKAAEKGSVRLQVLAVSDVSQVPENIEAGIQTGASALLVLEDALTVAARQQISDLCLQFHLPAIEGDREFARAGGLMSYGVDRRRLFRRAAEFVDKLLKGAKPSSIPVEQPTKFELVINMKTAKLIGLHIPDSVLALADEVIE